MDIGPVLRGAQPSADPPPAEYTPDDDDGPADMLRRGEDDGPMYEVRRDALTGGVMSSPSIDMALRRRPVASRLPP